MNTLIKLLKILMNIASLVCLCIIWLFIITIICRLVIDGEIDYFSSIITPIQMVPFIVVMIPLFVFITNKMRKYLFTINSFKIHIGALSVAFCLLVAFSCSLVKYTHIIIIYWK